jgi:hypothetical protein
VFLHWTRALLKHELPLLCASFRSRPSLLLLGKICNACRGGISVRGFSASVSCRTLPFLGAYLLHRYVVTIKYSLTLTSYLLRSWSHHLFNNAQAQTTRVVQVCGCCGAITVTIRVGGWFRLRRQFSVCELKCYKCLFLACSL